MIYTKMSLITDGAVRPRAELVFQRWGGGAPLRRGGIETDWCWSADVREELLILEEAARRSGLHPHTIQRLLQQGRLLGHKTVVRGRLRWVVSARSLRAYTNPINGFLLDEPGPKLFLRRLNDSQDEGS
jgi:hypothetical protein